MQFKNPEVLFFLFLLLIPLLIHLFHLQRFSREAFTNVQFLKEIELESRKSSKLKKLLILLSRMLAFTALIFAFAQPFINNNEGVQKRKTIYYLDNSFSMELNDDAGINQLQKSQSFLLDNSQDDAGEVSLLSNQKSEYNLNHKNLSNSIVKLDFHPAHKDLNQILLEINTQHNTEPNTVYDVFLISDFQKINGSIDSALIDKNTQYNIVNTAQKNGKNIAIDSIWISSRTDKQITLKTQLSCYGKDVEDLSVSLFLNQELYGKSSISIPQDSNQETTFIIPADTPVSGRISISDRDLNFDNNLFFSLKEKSKKKVLVVGKKSDFIHRIYKETDFNLTEVSYEQLDQGQISKQDLIILNEIEKISKPFIQSLNAFVSNQGRLVIIPANKALIASYNELLNSFSAGSITDQFEREKDISFINYEHPFFKNVFENEVYNFQFPNVSQGFNLRLNNASPLLQFEDKTLFASEIRYNMGRIYLLASPLSIGADKFINSPLIVPLFYNFSIESSHHKALYLILGKTNQLTLSTTASGDQPLTISGNEQEFIPIQSRNNDKINVTTKDFPLTSGVYEFKTKSEAIEKIAYNYNRIENDLNFQSLTLLSDKFKNMHLYESLNKAIKNQNQRNNNKALWQLFIIFALVFLVLEILLQRFLKN